MKRRLLCGLLLAGAWHGLGAPTATDLNEGLQVAGNPATGTYQLSFWGRAGRSYFIQTSETLTMWAYLPAIETGADGVLQYGLATSAPKQFFRLRHTGQTAADPMTADFDGDGLSNGWELMHGLDPLDPADALLASAKPGFTNLDEFRLGTDPRVGLSPASGALVALCVFSPLE